MIKAPLSLLVGFFAHATGAQAHDIWITFNKAGGECRAVVNYGHPHDRPPALADKIVEFTALTRQDRLDLMAGLTYKFSAAAIVVESRSFDDQGHTLVAVNYENGFWAKTPSGGYRNATRRSMPDAVNSIWSVKFAKAVTGPGAPWGTVTGAQLEIVPLADPAALMPGQTLRARVLFFANPLRNAAVERTDGITLLKD
jgi:nickel transport protein